MNAGRLVRGLLDWADVLVMTLVVAVGIRGWYRAAKRPGPWERRRK